MREQRVFFYVQHLLGIGHSMRAALIAKAMTKSGLAVTLVNGGAPNALFDPGPINTLQLPPALSADASFSTIIDETGAEVTEAWRNNRRKAILDAYEKVRPDLTLIESFPFGRWSFRSEIYPLLERAKPVGPILCSVRDILVPKKGIVRNQKIVEIINSYFTGVLVHGDAEFIKLDHTFSHTSEIMEKIHYTGYVAPPAGTVENMSNGEIVVSVGGGVTGFLLISTALSLAQSSVGKNWRWRILTGPNFPQTHKESFQSAPHIKIEGLRHDFRALLAKATLSISQAGYNTVMDILVTGIRNVLVPFGRYGQTEQPLRAKVLADRKMSVIVNEKDLNTVTLGSAIEKALTLEPPIINKLNVHGAINTARKIKHCLETQ
mgnify:CR=1 FL=1|tara:strand:+ start:2227 stop:3357 length:1131 start_codon:yes stop_codon:yes gene_type:complete